MEDTENPQKDIGDEIITKLEHISKLLDELNSSDILQENHGKSNSE